MKMADESPQQIGWALVESQRQLVGICPQNFVDDFVVILSFGDFVVRCEGHVVFQLVCGNELGTVFAPLLWRYQAHVVFAIVPLVHVVYFSRDFLEVAGYVMELVVEAGFFQDGLGLLLQEPDLLGNDLQLASGGRSRELVGRLNLLGKLNQIELIRFTRSIWINQC